MEDLTSAMSVSQRTTRLRDDLSDLVQILVVGLSEQLSHYDIDAVEYTVLSTCFNARQITLRELRVVVPIGDGHLSRVVTRLEDMDLVERVRRRGDRRVVYLKLTEAGQALIPELMKGAQEYYARLIRGIDQEEMSGCMAVMEKMIAE